MKLPVWSSGGAVQDGEARFGIGQVVRHRVHPFRGVIFDVDPVMSLGDEWWLSIPEQSRPRREQPYYHLLAEGQRGPYIAYVSEQNLVADGAGGAVGHPQVRELFGELRDGFYEIVSHRRH